MTNSKRGRKNVLSDEVFIEYFSKAEYVNDVVECLKNHKDFLEGEEKEKFEVWITGKDQKDLELFVSAKASNLRKKGVVFTNAHGTNKFHVGRRPKFKVLSDELKDMLSQETSDTTSEDISLSV